nr:MAG: hypothetical protein [Bacteriophage sp.]
MIELPMDAEGREIPLDTKVLYRKDDALCNLDSSGPGTRAKLADLIEGKNR